jgi:hypothetical protein
MGHMRYPPFTLPQSAEGFMFERSLILQWMLVKVYNIDENHPQVVKVIDLVGCKP